MRHCFCLLHLSKYNSFSRKSQSNSDIYFRTPGGGRGAGAGHAEPGRKTAVSAFISASKKLLIIFTKMKCSFHIALIYCNRAQEKTPDTLSFTSFISFFSTNRNASRPETGGFRFETYPLFLYCPLPALQTGSAADQKQSPLRIRICIRCAEVFLISANTFHRPWNDKDTGKRAAFPKKGRG